MSSASRAHVVLNIGSSDMSSGSQANLSGRVLLERYVERSSSEPLWKGSARALRRALIERNSLYGFCSSSTSSAGRAILSVWILLERHVERTSLYEFCSSATSSAHRANLSGWVLLERYVERTSSEPLCMASARAHVERTHLDGFV